MTIAKKDEIHGVVDTVDHVVSQTSVIGTSPAANTSPPSRFQNKTGFVNLCSESQGARILFATDEWFAPAHSLLKEGPPQFDPNAYCEQGKVMDGWETRRRREEGHDWCLIRLSGRAHEVCGIEIDTAHFTGNNVPALSLEAVDLSCAQEAAFVSKLPGAMNRLLFGSQDHQGTGSTPQEVEEALEACRSITTWKELLPPSPLHPGYEETRMHCFPVSSSSGPMTHVRVNYYPDGGVARLRLWGTLSSDPPRLEKAPLYLPITTGSRCTVVPHTSVQQEKELPSRRAYEHPELSSTNMGGKGVSCSNKHYGVPQNLLQSNLGVDMGDGWETARHPSRPGSWKKNPETQLLDSDLKDWAVVRLGIPASSGIERIILDTRHFRGNYPESVLVEGVDVGSDSSKFVSDDGAESIGLESLEWFPLVERCRMSPDSEHVFDQHQLTNAKEKVTHVRVSIFPDGGLSRVRVYGKAN